MNQYKIVIKIIIFFIILFLLNFCKNAAYKLSYRRELKENPVYCRIGEQWYQNNFSDEMREIKLPENFEVLTILRSDENLKWIGIRGGEIKQLAELDIEENSQKIIFTETQLSEYGIKLDEVSQVQYQPENEDISFVCKNVLYVFDRKSGVIKVLCEQILPHETYTKGYSYLWLNKSEFYYIDKDTHKINLYDCETKKGYSLEENAFELYELSLKENNLLYMQIGQHEFMAYIVYGGIYIMKLNGESIKKKYEYYGGTDIINMHADTKGVILKHPSKDNDSRSIFYFKRLMPLTPELKLEDGDNSIQQILWP